MSEITNQDLKELILAMDKKFDQRFAEVNLQFADMDKKMEVGFAEIKGEIKRVETELKRVEEKLIAKIDGVDGKLTEKMSGLDKRLGNEEIINRSVLLGFFATALTSATKFFFFTDKV